MSQPAAGTGEVVVYHKRRNVELSLIILAQCFGLGGWIITNLSLYQQLPDHLYLVTGIWFAMGIAANIVVRIVAPYADPVILPCVFLLNGLGLAEIFRLDQVSDPISSDAATQLLWTGLGIVLFALVIIFFRDHRKLQRYPYLLFLAGIALLMLPMIPGLGVFSGGARICIRLGPFSFQPAEVAKIVLAIAFAAYFYEKRDLLALAGRRFLGLELPRARDLGPIAVMWVMALGIMVFQNDLGTALLFFGLFTVMIYIATERPAWPILAALGFAGAAVLAFNFTSHVPRRVNAWLDPFSDYDANLQIISAQFGLAWGGLFGRGWGLGRPALTPLPKSDFIATSLGEEIGIVGLMAIIVLYALIVARGLKTSLICADGFGKLLAGGLSFVFALQVFAIIAGVTKLLPLTGLTTPFMSQGGSSLIANWMLIGFLLTISHRSRQPKTETVEAAPMAAVDDQTAVIKA